MATESKAVDLGKLQDEERKARVVVRSLGLAYSAAHRRMELAQASRDLAWAKWNNAQKELDKAKQAVLDGARSVAQG